MVTGTHYGTKTPPDQQPTRNSVATSTNSENWYPRSERTGITSTMNREDPVNESGRPSRGIGKTRLRNWDDHPLPSTKLRAATVRIPISFVHTSVLTFMAHLTPLLLAHAVPGAVPVPGVVLVSLS